MHNKKRYYIKSRKFTFWTWCDDEFHSQQKVSESWCSAFVIFFLVLFWVWLIMTPFLCKLQAQKLQCLEALPSYHQFFTELLLDCNLSYSYQLIESPNIFHRTSAKKENGGCGIWGQIRPNVVKKQRNWHYISMAFQIIWIWNWKQIMFDKNLVINTWI